MSTQNSDHDYKEHQRNVTHYINEKIKKNGGPVGIGTLVHSIPTELDENLTPHMVKKIIRGDSDPDISDRFVVGREDQNKVVKSVDPIGSVPGIVQQCFNMTISTPDLKSIPEFDDGIVEHLNDEGYTSLEDVANADPQEIKRIANEAYNKRASDCDFTEVTHLSKSVTSELQNQGINTAIDLLTASPETIVENDSRNGINVTASDITAAQSKLRKGGFRTFTDTEATSAVKTAEINLPSSPHITEKSLKRIENRISTAGSVQAIIKQTEEENETVGEPIAHVHGLDPTDPEAVYESDIGVNDSDPVNTGLTILEDVGYDRVPKPETHPEAGNGGLPVDENGEVIPPAVPIEPNLQLPMDELIAKILAVNKPLMIKGPRGCGKNYLLKYICYRTNRGYRSFDAHERMVAEDLFGPISPDKDGVLEPKNADFIQGLINGDVIVIDEFTAMPPNVGMSLHQLLQDNEVAIPYQGRYVKPHPEARIVATRNPPTMEYAGNHDNNAATFGRFSELEQQYISSVSRELEAIDRQVNSSRLVVDTDTLEDVIEFAHKTRKEKNSNWPTISSRDIGTICEYIDFGASARAATKKVLKKRAQQGQPLDTVFNALGETV